jgi:hypothetical protein
MTEDEEAARDAFSGLKDSFKKRMLKAAVEKKPLGLLLKHRISKSAKTYGISLAELRIKSGAAPGGAVAGSGEMLSISVSVKNIDYGKLAAGIEDITRASEIGSSNALSKAAGIVKPFIGKTMATIPLPAVAELFDLLARDKVIELADNYGVTISSIFMKSG